MTDWYPFYWRDYRIDTRHLTLAEDGAYRRLIDEYYETRQPLPDDDAALARIVGVSVEEWRAVAVVVREFFVERGGYLIHERITQELDAQDRRLKQRTEKAKKAAKRRWAINSSGNGLDATSNAYAMHMQCNRNAKAMLGDATETSTEDRVTPYSDTPPSSVEPTEKTVPPAPPRVAAVNGVTKAKDGQRAKRDQANAVWEQWVEDFCQAAENEGAPVELAMEYIAAFLDKGERPIRGGQTLTELRRADAARRFRNAGNDAAVFGIEVYVDKPDARDYRLALKVAENHARLTKDEQDQETSAHRRRHRDGLFQRTTQRAGSHV